MTATRVLGGILFVCALTIGELMNAVDAVSSHWVPENMQVADPQGSSAHRRGLPYFGECWAPAPIFITNITANDHALMQASSEGLVALPPTQQQGEGETHLFFFNGDASAGIAAAKDSNIGSSFELLKTLPPSSGGSIIPAWLRAQGHTHSGDSDLLWLPTTNTTSAGGGASKKGHVEPFIIVPSSGWPKVEPLPTFFAVNAKTLEDESRTLFSCQPTREEVNRNGQQQFAPWVAVQPPAAAAAAPPHNKTTVQQSFFYSSDYYIVEELFVYEVVETNHPNKTATTTAADDSSNAPRFGCKTHHTIKLSQGLIGAQGGSFLNHTHLLLASDDECIYTIDTRSGQVTVAACLWLQNLTKTSSSGTVAIATKSLSTTAASSGGDDAHHHTHQQQSHNDDVVTIFEMEGLAVADMTTLGWGMLHVLTGDTKLATHDGGTRPVFHLDYVC